MTAIIALITFVIGAVIGLHVGFERGVNSAERRLYDTRHK